MLDELQKEFDRLAEQQNNTGLPEFEGYSSSQSDWENLGDGNISTT